jgi:NitT/TauT family transport system permease protein
MAVIILFFGLGEISKIALLFIGTFFQMILLIIDDIRHIPKDYFDLSRTLGFSRMKIFTMKLRAVGPQLYDNARITLGFAWTYLVIAELVAAQAGVGYVIKEAQRFSDTPRVYIAILSLGVLGLFTDQLFKLFYPYFFPYKKYD